MIEQIANKISDNNEEKEIVYISKQRTRQIWRVLSIVKVLHGGRTFTMEGPVRLELTTPCLKGRCSNRLSYGPVTVRIYHFTGNIVKVAR